MHPSEVKVIGVCQASVIFGIGREKFRTEIVKGNDPTWNEETVLKVTNQNASLLFTVTDKEDILGQISLPVSQLPSAAHKRRWLPLKRKNHPTSSDLCIDCWVTELKKDSPSETFNIWNKFKTFSSGSSNPRDKRRESIIGASTGMKGSTSTLELYSKSLEEDRRESIKDEEDSRKVSLSGRTNSSSSLNVTSPRTSFLKERKVGPKLQPTLGALMSMKGPPEITGISPRFGPCSGGTKIIIRGCNLGLDKEDFLGFRVCSCDCLDTMEYHSPAKLVCVTKPWDGRTPNAGPIILVTKSGGRGVSTIEFEFQGEAIRRKKGEQNGVNEQVGAKDKIVMKEETSKKHQKGSHDQVSEEKLLSDIERLRQDVRDLKSENKSLKKYIDNLMVVLMEQFPEALEATSAIPLTRK